MHERGLRVERNALRRRACHARADHGPQDALVVRAGVFVVMANPAGTAITRLTMVMLAEVEVDLRLGTDDPRKLERNQRRDGEQPRDQPHGERF